MGLPDQLTFEHIRLNSSVQPPDVNRLKGHVQRLYRLFYLRKQYGRAGWVSTEALMDVGKAQYQARLKELRHWLIPEGWCIDLVERGEGGNNFYKLVPLSESTFYAEREDELRGLTQ